MNSHLLGEMPGHCFSRRLQREYELMSFVSDGTYGEVWKAVRKVAGQRVYGCLSDWHLRWPLTRMLVLRAPDDGTNTLMCSHSPIMCSNNPITH